MRLVAGAALAASRWALRRPLSPCFEGEFEHLVDLVDEMEGHVLAHLLGHGVLIDKAFGQCQDCDRLLVLGSIPPAPGVYRVVGSVAVDTGLTRVSGTIVGPPFLYTGLGVAPSPLP